MSDTQQAKEDARQWFLRTGGESVFGPVSTQGLIVWAEQGRILPGHEVSTDRKKWAQAVSVDLLDMRWYVDDGEGELRGPLNKLAAEALIKSGKVNEGAQLVSADEVEMPAGSEKEPKQAERAVREPVPEEVLRVRIRELEAMVSSQRERLSKLSNVEAIETVCHERDVLAALVKEVETQRDTILRNAEKDTRSHERKLELTRQQVKKLEQQLEDAHSRLLLADQAAGGQAPDGAGAPDGAEPNEGLAQEAEALRARLDACEKELSRAREQGESRQAELVRDAEGLRARLAESERILEELRTGAASREAELAQSAEALQKRVAELEQAVAFHERRAAETGQIVSTREAELERAQKQLEANAQRLREAEAASESAEQRLREAESSFAELLSDANARDSEYLDKISALEKACAQPPEETARFYADQAAVFDLAKAEVEELTKTMEMERTHVEQLKEWNLRRQQALAERRQTLLRQLGDSPAEMTRRTLRELPSDPNAARLRTELDNLRAAHERELRQAEDRERDSQRKLRVLESEAAKYQGLAIEGEKMGRRMQEIAELLRRREQELSDERKNREAEREQFQSSQQALLMRIESLEKAARPSSPDEIQSADARNVKIATWMRLRK